MKILNKIFLTIMAVGLLVSCQKMDRPVLGDYPKDANPPGGPLKFYAAFDGITDDPLMNAVDSVMANFPGDNQLKSIDGISGKAVQGEKGKEIKYASTNGFVQSTSFSVSFWVKTNVVPEKEAQFIFSIPTESGSNGNMMLFLDHKGAGSTVDGAVIKFYIADKKGDTWIGFEGADRVPNFFDNNWHHLVFTYDETSSTLSLYKDGALFKTRVWSGHGKIEINADKVSGLKIMGKTPSWGEEWQGGMDQFRLYGKVLSAAEIAELYNGKK